MEMPKERVALLSSDEGGGSEESSEDEVTEHVPPPPVSDMAANHAQVPTISVTPHSPGVLDDSLQQLRRLHATVQLMRVAPLPHVTGSGRLSTSCPSLCKDGDSPMEGDCSSPSATPTHLDFYPHSRKGSGESRQWVGWDAADEGRRRSWAALEPGARIGETRRQRSMSLSSMESEGEVDPDGRAARALLPGTRRPRTAQSTHSLNEADLQKDFEKVTAALRCAAAAEVAPVDSLQPRLPLQKSVSTPSIVAAIQPMLQPTGVVTQNMASRGWDSEWEERAAPVSETAAHHAISLAHQQHQLGLHQLQFLAQSAYDHHSEKRRKRGSLFFRKKKDKSRKASHAWQAANAGGDCDVCNRPLSDKPSLYCENCTTTVHQNLCKDYIIECTKPKSSKTSVGKSLSANSGKSSKRSSLSNQSQNTTSTSHNCSDDKEGSDHKHDQSNASDDAGSSEWPEAYLTPEQLGPEAQVLGLGVPEPDTWGASASKILTKSLTDREVKRQEHIYELVLTEKHHCLTIRLMEKMFGAGMVRGAGVSAAQAARMFPRLPELWALHAALLARLRARQAAAPTVSTVADILLEHFTGATAAKFKSAYGEFCSRHRDAVDVFKECCAREARLARFIRKCQANPLLRKKGVPECVLFVAQRLTKYPLLLEPLLKTAGDDMLERERLQKALAGVKEILVDVDGQVAAKEREDRKLEIYHRIDAKSCATYRQTKFKKSDILQGNRSLKFEGVATLMQGRSKMQTLLVIVLTDCLFFLHDNNNKYTFFTPDNKTGVVSLQKLLVREKAGADGRGLYIICSSPSEPEMFELRVHKPKDLSQWITNIRAAVQNCPIDEDDAESGSHLQSAEERQRQLEARHENIRLISEALRVKDKEHALLLEEKMALHVRLMATAGGGVNVGHTMPLAPPGLQADFALAGLTVPDYARLAAPTTDTHSLWQEVCKVVKEAMELSAWGSSGSGLGRSTSSAGERHSVAYESPALPRRAETFGGFDNQHPVKDIFNTMKQVHQPLAVRRPTDNGTDSASIAEGVEPEAGVEPPPPGSERLQHCLYTLMCIVWQQLTTVHSLEAQLAACRGGGLGTTNSGATSRSHELQLEELRDAQARLTAERAAWEAQRAADADALAAERRMLARANQQLAEQQRDVEQQRERLYRRLERLQQQQHGGSQEEIASVGTLSPETSLSDTSRRKEPKWRGNRGSTGSESSLASAGGVLPPPQLLSAQNERRATAAAQAQPVLVKQQLPLKLASGRSQSLHQQAPPGYQRLHDSPGEQPQGLVIQHTRTGSSPAPLPSGQQQLNNKATRTNTYPKLPDKFRVRSPDAVPPCSPPAQPPPQPEEEVIYF